MEYLRRYEPPLLERARRAGIVEDERRQLVCDVLDDAVLHVLRTDSFLLTGTLAAYLGTALDQRAWKVRRGATRRRQWVDRAADELAGRSAGVAERTVTSACSAYVLRATSGLAAQRGDAGDDETSPGVTAAPSDDAPGAARDDRALALHVCALVVQALSPAQRQVLE